MNIEPGKSVGAEDNESCIDSFDSRSSHRNSDDYELSTDSSNSDSPSKKYLPSSSFNKNKKYQIDDFIAVRFNSSRKSLLYTGKILKVNVKTLEVCFMQKVIGKNTAYFSFPAVKDECEIDVDDIVCVVKNGPKDLRRNRYVFPNLSFDIDLLNEMFS